MGSLSEKLNGAKGKRVMMGSGFVTAIFNTVALLIIARNAGPTILGSLGFMLAYMGLFLFIGDLGYGLVFGRLLDRGFSFGRCYRAFLMAKVRLTLSMGLISGILIAVYAYALAPDSHTALHPVAMLMILGYYMMVNLAGIWVLSMKLRKRRPLPHDLVDSLVKVVMVVGLFMLFNPRGDQELIFRLCFIYLIAGTLTMMLVRNSARGLKLGEKDEEIEVEFHDSARKFIPFIAFSALILNIDKVALWMASDFTTLGIFFGAQRITIFIAASAAMIEAMLGDAISRYIKENNTEGISKSLRMTERYISLMAIPVATFYVFFSDSLLKAFLGSQFIGGGVAVSLLAGAGVFITLATPHLSYLLRADKTRELTMIAGTGFAVMLGILAILLPDLVLPDADIHGMNGTAIAVLASSVSMFITARYVTWRMLGCKPHPRMLNHLLSAGLMMATIQFIVRYFSIEVNVAWILGLAVIGFFVYIMCLYLTGEMVRKDYHEFRNVIKPE